jgi:hypothetical protein
VLFRAGTKKRGKEQQIIQVSHPSILSSRQDTVLVSPAGNPELAIPVATFQASDHSVNASSRSIMIDVATKGKKKVRKILEFEEGPDAYG